MRSTVPAVIVSLLLAACVQATPSTTTRPAATVSPPSIARRPLWGRESSQPDGKCAAPGPGAYGVQLLPSAGPPGTPVLLTGDVPTDNEAGHYIGPSGGMRFWWNVNLGDWVSTIWASPTPAQPGPVFNMGHVKVTGVCTFRVAFNVPDVPPGPYPVLSVTYGQGGAAGIATADFAVTQSPAGSPAND